MYRSTNQSEPDPVKARSLFLMWLPAGLLVLATILAYQPVWHAGFIWDDDFYVTNNWTLHDLNGLKYIWFVPGATAQYYPLTFTTFWLEYHIWGLRPLGYHLVNVLLHSFNAILFWLILRKLKIPGAWLAAGIFALHPVCVESVAWVTERKNTLAGLFYLGSLLAALRFWLPAEALLPFQSLTSTSNVKRPSGRWKFYWLALAFYVCALVSKTAAVPLPVVVLLLIWWRRGMVVWREALLILPFLAVGAAMGLITLHVEKHLGAIGYDWNLSLLERCLVAGKDFWFYLEKLFWPHPLIFVYPRWEINPSQAAAYLPILAVASCLFVLWLKRDGWGYPVLFATAYFGILISLTLGFLNVFYFRYSFVSDHFQYLAMLGPLALAAAGISTVLGRLGKSRVRVEPALCVTVLLTLGVLTWRQCGMYTDLETLWRTTLDRNPDCWLAHNNLGSVLLVRGQVDEAIEQFQEALRAKPDDSDAYFNLGLAFDKEGQMDKAIGKYQEALRLNPNSADFHNSLGDLLGRKGQVDEAISEYQEALRLNPNYVEAHNNLGNALGKKGLLDQAIREYQTALRLNPDFAECHYNLGIAHYKQGRLDEAIDQFQEALRLDPNYVEAHNNLGIALYKQGRLDEAIGQFQEALRLNPNYPVARENLVRVEAMKHAPADR